MYVIHATSEGAAQAAGRVPRPCPHVLCHLLFPYQHAACSPPPWHSVMQMHAPYVAGISCPPPHLPRQRAEKPRKRPREDFPPSLAVCRMVHDKEAVCGGFLCVRACVCMCVCVRARARVFERVYVCTGLALSMRGALGKRDHERLGAGG